MTGTAASRPYGSLNSDEGEGEGDELLLLQESSRVQDLPDALSPSFESPLRESSAIVAIFNLLNTMVGGGALSLPYAFAKCGWLGGVVLVLFSVKISNFALSLLCTLARKVRGTSYPAIVGKTMGGAYAEALDATQFFMLFLVVIAFLILIRDISGDVVEFLMFGPAYSAEDDVLQGLDAHSRSLLLHIMTAAMLPLMAQESLHALRHVSYVGSASVMLLLGVIAHKAYLANTRNGEGFWNSVLAGGPRGAARLGPEKWGDVLTALPIILIAFLCQFNIVGVFTKLERPSPSRTEGVILTTNYASGAVYILFGLSGYLFSTDRTADNILNNFSPKDPSLALARSGLVLTLMCQIPMVLLPCRDSLFRLMMNLSAAVVASGAGGGGVEGRRQEGGEEEQGEQPHVSSLSPPPLSSSSSRVSVVESTPKGGGSDFSLAKVAVSALERIVGRPLLAVPGAVLGVLGSSSSASSGAGKDDEGRVGARDDGSSPASASASDEEEQGSSKAAAPVEAEAEGTAPISFPARLFATLVLVASALFFAERVPGVASIWQAAGSSISLLLAFVFPALAYISLWWRLGRSCGGVDFEAAGAWSLLVTGLLMVLLCTAQTIYG